MMNLLTNLQKPIWLFVIGMIIVLFAVFLKTVGVLKMLQVPFFAIGLIIEIMALIIFLKREPK